MIEDPVLPNDWHALLKSSDLREGSLAASRLLEEDLVLWRINGRPHAWQDLCVHRGSKLSLGRVERGKLVCAYHGWTYGEDGMCVGFPAHPGQKPSAKAAVKTYEAFEKYGLVWVRMKRAGRGESASTPPVFTEWDDPTYRKILCGPYHYRASAPRAVENFLDVAHLPFVHSGLLGEESQAEIADYTVEVTPEGITARNVRIWQPDPDGTGVGKEVVYTYEVLRPLTMRLSKDTDEGRFSIFATVTPTGQCESMVWMWLALNYAHEIPERELRSFQDNITMQDVRVVESQRPELLPLDLQAELHLRSDRIAVAYRKWLRKLGLSFGTA